MPTPERVVWIDYRDFITQSGDKPALPTLLLWPGLRMRVSISHHTIQKGLLFKTTYQEVHLSVALTHEEKQIIRQRNLLKTKLLDRRPATAKVDDRDEKFELRVEHLVDGQTDCFLCANPSQAKIYEDNLLEMLAQMKLWIDDNAETGDRTVVEF